MTTELKVTEELLPCPFCGATDGDLVQAFTRATDEVAFWSVECLGCGVEVASDASQAEADQHWNQRHHQADDATLERVARAICYANCSVRMSEDAKICQMENGWDLWLKEAKAAIAAMREDG